MTDIRSDLRQAIRSLRAAPGFTIVALAVLTLGIGATTAIFSVVDAVVLRGLPFDEHDRLVAVGQRDARPVQGFGDGPPPPPGPARGRGAAPPPGAAATARVMLTNPGQGPNATRDPAAVSASAPQNYMDWAARQQVFEAMAAIANGRLTLREPGAEPEEMWAQRVTAGFFAVLRERPLLGRAFTADHEVQGNHQVAVLSDGLWRRRFGADPAIVGKRIPLEGAAYEVVGVMAPHFAYPIGAPRPTDLWVPYVVPPEERIRRPDFVSIYLSSIARLKPGVSLEQAQANLDQISAALTAEHPQWNATTLAGVRPLIDHIVGARTRQWMLLLLGAVALVLLIACANVANLLLARSSTRARDVGIRAALGAGRWRRIRGRLVESLLLSLTGTLLALVVAWWGVHVLRGAMPDTVPRLATIAVDVRVLGAAALISIVTGVLFGIVPALQLSRPDLTTALKDGARGASGGAAQRRARSLLVVVEVALAVVLLVAAALFIGSFRSLMKIDPGFNPRNVLTTSLQPRVERSPSGAPLSDFRSQFEEIVARLSRTPGVVHASAVVGGMPMGGMMMGTSVGVPGRQLEPRDRSISIRRVTPAYHTALGIPLVAGRFFEPTDRMGSQPVAILNRLAAARLFPGESAVGKILDVDEAPTTVVGVVGDVFQSNLETDPRTEVYVPLSQNRAVNAEIVIRTADDPFAVLPALKTTVLSVLPDVPLRSVRTMEQVFDRQIAQRRVNMLLLGLFGVLGLAISSVGIYGVMAYSVAQRTREIGVRIALGATRWSVVRLVLVRGGVLVGAGLAIGGAGAWYLRSLAETFLFRMNTSDLRVFATAVGALAGAALVASLVPARRAATVDPVVSLRAD
jgi:putative ABC transport system permease protein